MGDQDSSVGYDFVSVVQKHRLLVVWVTASILIMAAALALGLPDRYRSTVTFNLLQNPGATPDEFRASPPDQYVFGLSDRVMRSAELKEIIADLNPYPELADDPGAALAELRSDIDVSMISESILGGGGREEEVRKGFAVSYDSPSPDMAYSVASRLVQIFFDVTRTGELERVTHDINFLTAEVERTRGYIAEQERRLSEFKERNFNALPEVAQVNMTLRGQAANQLDNVEREIRSLQQNRVFLTQQLQQAQQGPSVSNLQQLEGEYARKAAIYAPGHPDLVSLRRQIESLRAAGPATTGTSLQAQLAAQRASLAEARQSYSDEHPDIRRLQRSIEALEARVAAGEPSQPALSGQTLLSVQLQTQLNSVDTQISGLREQASQTRVGLAQLESRLGSTPEVEREYQALTRDLGSARQQYGQLIDRRMDAEVSGSAISSGALDRFVVLDKPGRPLEPASPPRLKIMFLGLILATILAVGAAITTELLDPNVRGSRDIHNTLRISPLAVIPEIRNSVVRQRRAKRTAVLASSLLIAAPVLYFVVRALAP